MSMKVLTSIYVCVRAGVIEDIHYQPGVFLWALKDNQVRRPEAINY